MNNQIALYVSSPFSYKDIFDVFYKCYNSFWKNPTIPFVLSTNYEANYNGVRIISSGNINDTWVERSLPALKQLNEKYVLLMCDDLFINKNVNEQEIFHIIEAMDRYKINFCRLNPCNDGVLIDGEENLKRLYKTTPYARNLQIGIFNREYLISLIENGNRSAWDIESDWQKESVSAKRVLFDDIIGVNRYIISYIHCVQKGCILPSSLKALSKLGLSLNSKRPIMPKKNEIIQNFKIQLRSFFTPRMRYKLKQSLKKVGFNFTSDY